MRVCPKCGFIDPPAWKHSKFSYHIDTCRIEEFEKLHPNLAKNLVKGGDITEDKNYYYRLTKKKCIVMRKAKIEWTEENPFGAEKYEKFKHNTILEDNRPYWNKVNPNQKQLISQNSVEKRNDRL